MKMLMTEAEKHDLTLRIAESCKTDIITLYPALGAAFAMLPAVPAEENAIYTDGESIFCPLLLIHRYAEDPCRVRRGFLHILLHCLYGHIFPPEGVDRQYWDLACDMIVESMMDELGEPRLAAPVSALREKMKSLFSPPLPIPEVLCSFLEKAALPCPLQALEAEYSFDSHRLPDRSSSGLRKKWADALAFTNENSGGQGKRGDLSGSEAEDIIDIDSAPFDYRRYLRRFTVPREEIESDPDSFDYIYYCLGLDTYGDLPLVEPLEYREVWRLDELVIAMDTSGSCTREMVSGFLKETYAVISDRENFFRQMRVVFMQCDCCLQDITVIRSREEWEKYASRVKILGRGGTDFRPVFNEIRRLRDRGILKKPRALLYFTDGDGAFPTYAPDYEVIFVMKGDTVEPELMPPWVRVLRLP